MLLGEMDFGGRQNLKPYPLRYQGQDPIPTMNVPHPAWTSHKSIAVETIINGGTGPYPHVLCSGKDPDPHFVAPGTEPHPKCAGDRALSPLLATHDDDEDRRWPAETTPNTGHSNEV